MNRKIIEAGNHAVSAVSSQGDGQSGMTLLDYFAIEAGARLLILAIEKGTDFDRAIKCSVRDGYTFARAMLEERQE